MKLVVPFAVGGGTDVLARLLSRRLAERLGPLTNYTLALAALGMAARFVVSSNVR